MHKIFKIYTAIYILLLPLPDYCKVMEALFSVKIFSIEFSPDLHVLSSPEFKKVISKIVLVNYLVSVGDMSIRLLAQPI